MVVASVPAGALTLAQLEASSPAPLALPDVLADEVRLGRIARVDGGYALTPAGLDQLGPLRNLTSTKET